MALAGILAAEGLPEPDSVAYGQTPLRELYRQLYGEEGV